MKIGLNATCLTARSSGAAQRFRGLYGELFNRLSNVEFVVYEPSDCEVRNWFDGYENVRFIRTQLLSENRLQRYIFGKIFWNVEINKNEFDWFESVNLPIVNSMSCRNLLTIHDIRDLKLKGNAIFRGLYRYILDDSVKKAHKIIAVSESAREEMLDYYPNASISVVYNGVNVCEFQNVKNEAILEVKNRLKLPNEFILTVGHFEKRKNYLRLIDALSYLHKKSKNVNLVIVGNDNGELEAVRKRANILGVSDKLLIFNGLSDFDVRAIYRAAKLLVFPSSYEGFGIPVIEAMAAEIPVVLSDIPVFKEITQGNGFYFDHNDSESIAHAIEYVLSSTSEAERLVQYGRHRVIDFNFATLALEIEKIYKDMA
ncbi:MAG: glycosyltransferase family 4 protein [Methylocystis sp.]|nr:glycosyltransferase family 4 protein [Methylocystis sp.]